MSTGPVMGPSSSSSSFSCSDRGGGVALSQMRLPGEIVGTEVTHMGERYLVADSGERFIPATQRADGSKRKQIRVKHGFVPTDEQRRYRSKLAAAQDVMHQTTSTTTGPPGWVAPKSTLLPTKPPGKSCGKKKKKKENKCEFVPEFDPSISLVTPSNPTQIDQQLADKLDQTCTLDPSKRLRNLLKKFKEIEMLEATTSLDQLTDAQREKLSRKADLERQIKQLESPKSTES